MGQRSSSETVQDQTEVDGPQSPVKVLRPPSSGSNCEPPRNMFRDHFLDLDDSPFSVVRRCPVFYSTIRFSWSTDGMFSPLQPDPRQQRLERARKALLDKLQSYDKEIRTLEQKRKRFMEALMLDDLQSYRKEIRTLEQKRKWAIEALMLDDLQSYRKEFRLRTLRRGLSSESLSDMFMHDLPMFQPPPPRFKQRLQGLSCGSLKSDRSKEQPLDFRTSFLSKPWSSGLSCESLESDRSKDQPIDFRRKPSLPLLLSPVSPESLKKSRSMDDPPDLSAEPFLRSEPGPSGLSCDRSKEQPIDFRRRSSLVPSMSPESPEPFKRSRSTDPAVL